MDLLVRLVVLGFCVSVGSAYNYCTLDKYLYPSQPIIFKIFKYTCIGNDSNPVIPVPNDIYPGTPTSYFNTLDLSLNLYNQMPMKQVCLFNNLLYLNMSYNSLINMSGQYSLLSCLSHLTRLDLSHNEIKSSLMAVDVNDAFGNALQWFSLNDNHIQVVESAFFFKRNGQTRFPQLSFFSLANNKLLTLDLMWPLSLTSLTLYIDLASNPIVSLTNELNLIYDEPSFVPMTGNRYVNVENNSLTRLDDTNLLQYGINSASGFREFLYQISNFDFSQPVNKLVCYCSNANSLVNWYSQFGDELIGSIAPIYNLECSNRLDDKRQASYIFNYSCQAKTAPSTVHKRTSTTTRTTRRTTSTTTTTTTTKTTKTTSKSSSSTTQSTTRTSTKEILTVASVIVTTNKPNTTSSVSDPTQSIDQELNLKEVQIPSSGSQQQLNKQQAIKMGSSDTDLLLLLLLIIPIVFIIFLVSTCFLCRPVSYLVYGLFSIRIFSCCFSNGSTKPDESSNSSILCCKKSKKSNKVSQQDAEVRKETSEQVTVRPAETQPMRIAVCINQLDLLWFDEKFLPRLQQVYSKNNIDKITNSDSLSSSDEILLRSASRILVFLTPRFEKNGQLIKVLNEICLSDEFESMIIVITVGDVNKEDLMNLLTEPPEGTGKFIRVWKRLIRAVKHQYGFNYAELLDWSTIHFWPKFFYLMPDPEVDPRRSAVELYKNKSAEKDAAWNEGEVSTKRLTGYSTLPPLTPKRSLKDVSQVDFWQKIAPNLSNYSEFEPIGSASLSGNSDSNSKRFGVWSDRSPPAISTLAVPRLYIKELDDMNNEGVDLSGRFRVPGDSMLTQVNVPSSSVKTEIEPEKKTDGKKKNEKKEASYDIDLSGRDTIVVSDYLNKTKRITTKETSIVAGNDESSSIMVRKTVSIAEDDKIYEIIPDGRSKSNKDYDSDDLYNFDFLDDKNFVPPKLKGSTITSKSTTQKTVQIRNEPKSGLPVVNQLRQQSTVRFDDRPKTASSSRKSSSLDDSFDYDLDKLEYKTLTTSSKPTPVRKVNSSDSDEFHF